MATVKYLESVTKQQAKTNLQNTLKFYGLDAITDPNKILPPPAPVGGQIIMRNLAGLQNKDLVNSVPGMQLQKSLGEKSAETEAQASSILTGFQNAVQHGLPLMSKGLTAFQTFEDFHYKPTTSNTIPGDNLIFVADRMATGKFGSKFVLIPKALQVTGKGLRFLSKNGNALGFGLSVGIFISDRYTKQPLKCTSVLDVLMSAAPVAVSVLGVAAAPVGVIVIFVAGVYAAQDLAAQILTGTSPVQTIVDGACDYVGSLGSSVARGVKATGDWVADGVKANGPLPNSNNLSLSQPNSIEYARYQIMNQGTPGYKFNQ
jgi:hypothetical protein